MRPLHREPRREQIVSPGLRKPIVSTVGIHEFFDERDKVQRNAKLNWFRCSVLSSQLAFYSTDWPVRGQKQA